MAKPFEVQITRDGRSWSVKSSHDNEDQAVREAQGVSGNPNFKGVRAIHVAFGRDKVLWEYENKKEPPLTANAVEAAPACQSLDDFYKFGARVAGARILRKYLDRHAITALELLYSQGHLKMLNRTDPLFMQAVGVSAKVTAETAGVPQQQRIEYYYKAFDGVLKNARDAEDDTIPYKMLKSGGAEAMVKQIRADRAGGHVAFFIRGAFAGLLGEEGDYAKKLGLILGELERGGVRDALPYIDEIIAEIMDSAGSLREVLGAQADLAHALHTLSLLVMGRLEKADGVLGRLNAAIGQYDLPLTRDTLVDRLRNQFGGTQKLTREGGETENKAYRELLKAMITRAGLLGGPLVAEAAARRGAAVFSKDDTDQRVEFGIEGVVHQIPYVSGRIGFLLDLAGTETGKKYDFAVIRSLSEIITKPHTAIAFALNAPNTETAMPELRRSRDLLESAEFLSSEWKPRFLEKIDLLIADPEGQDAAAPAPAKGADMSDTPLGQRNFASGDYLFREGEPGDEAYLIKSGSVEISRRQGNRDTPLAKVGRGGIIGEMALIDDQPRMASARALEIVETTVIPKNSFKQRLVRLQSVDPVMKRLLEVFVERIRVQTRRN